MKVGRSSRSLLRFDLSTLPAKTDANQVSKATLKLWLQKTNVPGAVGLAPATSEWNERSVTGATTPGMGEIVASQELSGGGRWITFDLTAQVQEWIKHPESNFGIFLVPAPGSPGAVVSFSSQGKTATGHLAQLDITLGYSGSSGSQDVAGSQGPAGSTGPQGPAGAAGSTGPQGPAGAAGPQGLQGIAGVDGKTVRNGTGTPANDLGGDGDFYIDTAAVMLYGPKNAANNPVAPWGTGVALVGPKGPQGTAGPAGPQGPAGAAGPQGSQGPAGADGAPGPAGPQGMAGPAGPQGLQGIAGVNGKTVLSGATSPTVEGMEGDFYLDTSSHIFYGPKTASGWDPTTAFSLIGPQGPQGPAGTNGVDGAIYSDGSAGSLTISSNTNWNNTLPVNPCSCFQFTDFTINPGVTLTVPSGMVIHATGTVTIKGTIQVSTAAVDNGNSEPHPGVSLGPAGTPGGGRGLTPLQAKLLTRPGLMGGGAGSRTANTTNNSAIGTGGDGGGSLVIAAHGAVSVDGSIVANGADGIAANLVSAGSDNVGGVGGGGGGVVIIASSDSISVSGTIRVNGGKGSDGWDGTGQNGTSAGGGGGGGGIIYLLAPITPNITGTLQAKAGTPGANVCNNGNCSTIIAMGGGGGASGGDGGTGGFASIPPAAGETGEILTSVVSNPENLLIIQ